MHEFRRLIDLIESAQPRTARQWDAALPHAGDIVSGLRVRTGIDNLSSIRATITDPITLQGVREVPFSLFSGPDPITPRIRHLMAAIQESGEITPLIVVIDPQEGPYILEGSHRYDALQYLGCKTFPALVVLDNDNGDYDVEELDEPAPEPWHDDPDQLDLFRTKPLTESHEAHHYYAHVTNLKNVPAILKQGLVPNHNQGNYDNLRWVSLDGVYASKSPKQLEGYRLAHRLHDFGLVIISVQGDVLPDEDIIDTNLGRAFELTINRLGLATDDIVDDAWENGWDIDPNTPLWKGVISEFVKTLGPPSGPVPKGFIEQLVDFWFAVEHGEGSDALLEWGELKDRATRLFPQMRNVHTGQRHSIRIPTQVGFTGPNRIVAVLTCQGNDLRYVYDRVPEEDQQVVSDFANDFV